MTLACDAACWHILRSSFMGGHTSSLSMEGEAAP